MDDTYERYFEEIVSGDRDVPSLSHGDLRVLLDEIGYRELWRPDAYYFLAYNAGLMLFEPHRAEGSREQDEYVRAAFQRDVDKIEAVAAGIAQARRRDYVSSTTVAMALGTVAEHLETAAFQIWGPRRQQGVPA